MPRSTVPRLQKSDFEALSEFRYQLRRFVHFSEAAARREGLTPLQYMVLLHVRGFPGRDWATVGELADRMQMKHNATVALLTRCEALKLVQRRRSKTDGRVMEVHVLPAGERHLLHLAALHQSELRSLEDTFRVARITSFNDEGGADSARRLA
jgi:DNA-binding MarR family transcriptional regulator